MPLCRLRRFTKPQILRAIEPRLLIDLLGPFREDLLQRGITLPSADETDPRLDHDALAAVLADPGDIIPDKLIEALYFIDEMATDTHANRLLTDLRQRHPPVAVSEEATAAEIAVIAWLSDPDLVQRRHAERVIVRRKSFAVFRADASQAPELKCTTEEAFAPLKAALSSWFVLQRHGPVTRIFISDAGTVTWLMVRRGAIHERKECVEHGTSVNRFFQPAVYDVVGYDRKHGRLRINAELDASIEVYQTLIGEYVFGRPSLFTTPVRYTLEPLRTAGRGALVHSDIDGIDSINLTEVRFRMGGALRHEEITRAADVFAVFEQRKRRFPRNIPLVEAAFQIKFSDSRNHRMARICVPNRAKFARDDDSTVISEWLEARGFESTGEATDGATGLWAAVEGLPGYVASRREWEWRLGADFSWARQYLRPTDNIAKGLRTSDGRDLRIVQHSRNDLVVVTADGEEAEPITRAEALCLELDLDGLSVAMGNALDADVDVQPLSALPHARLIGYLRPYAGVAALIIMVVEFDPEALRLVCETCQSRFGPRMIVLAPNRKSIPVHERATSVPSESLFLAMADDLVFGTEHRFSVVPSASAKIAILRDAITPKPDPESGMIFFPTPANARWGDAKIRFVDGHTVSITVRDTRCRCTYIEMGMKDGRTGLPDDQWHLLEDLAGKHGHIDWDDPVATRLNRQRKFRLSRILQEFFRIDGDPIEAYGSGWKTRFSIEPDV